MRRAYSYAPIADCSCPFCLNRCGRVLYQVNSEEAALHFVPRWRDSRRNSHLQCLIQELWKGDSCRIVQCTHCSGTFAFPFVGGNSEFYETANAGQRRGAYPSVRWEYGQSLRLVKWPDSPSILEIGAGDGAFIRRLVEAGIAESAIVALEYSSYGMDAIRFAFPAIDVRHGDCLMNLPDVSFTHVFLFQVMEHLGDLDAFLKNLRRILRANGKAYISVPHPSRTELSELSGLTLDMPPNHISRFSRTAMEMLAIRNGLTLETMLDEPFSWREALPEFLRFHFARLAQKEGSIADRIHTGLNGKSHKFAAGTYALALLPHAVLRLGSSIRTGANRLFVVRKV